MRHDVRRRPFGPHGDHFLSEFNSAVQNRTAYIQRKDNTTLSAERVTLARDSHRCVATDGGARYTIAAHDVISVQTTNYVRGALKGFGLGLLAGAVILGCTFFPYPGRVFENLDDAARMSIAVPPTAVLFGAILGHRYEYHCTTQDIGDQP